MTYRDSFLLCSCDSILFTLIPKGYHMTRAVSMPSPPKTLYYPRTWRPGAVAEWLASWVLLTSGPRFNPWCRHIRRKFHPGHKCHSPHCHGPCLSIRPYLGESDVKLSHPSVPRLEWQQWYYLQSHHFRLS